MMWKETIFINLFVMSYVAAQTATNFTNGTYVPNACICTTAGYCGLAGGVAINDGSGIIQGRMMNNGPLTSFNSTILNFTNIKPAYTGMDLAIDSQDTCGDNFDNCCPTNGYTCGIRYPPVVNAPKAVSPQAQYGSYPFQVAIFNSTGGYVCSGVLLDQFTVLTAAHKIAGVSIPLTIRIGAWDVTAKIETLVRYDIFSSNVLIHPNYNSKNLKNDIALIKLQTKAPLGKLPTISNICLPNLSIDAFYGARCWVSGWGSVNTSMPSNILNEADVPIIDPKTCQNLLRKTALGANFVLDNSSFVCAGGEVGKDASMGDAGSPLSCFVNDRFYLIGLVSWGMGVGQANVPGVYVNVPSYIPWIQQTVAQMNGLMSSTLASNGNNNNATFSTAANSQSSSTSTIAQTSTTATSTSTAKMGGTVSTSTVSSTSTASSTLPTTQSTQAATTTKTIASSTASQAPTTVSLTQSASTSATNATIASTSQSTLVASTTAKTSLATNATTLTSTSSSANGTTLASTLSTVKTTQSTGSATNASTVASTLASTTLKSTNSSTAVASTTLGTTVNATAVTTTKSLSNSTQSGTTVSATTANATITTSTIKTGQNNATTITTSTVKSGNTTTASVKNGVTTNKANPSTTTTKKV
ncbi:hypothetical protein PVAND_015070 [Polypedilum vanderplanki]|uniref:Peptidase S1 domain-containing protein n=1 Tax=Polypedilum vanderplanki TaxID=319348 RepID=A0A9J6BBV6_POLVA|nr:hypothetical protein PVAND_015070 [Polypedilum vanderplanki]